MGRVGLSSHCGCVAQPVTSSGRHATNAADESGHVDAVRERTRIVTARLCRVHRVAREARVAISRGEATDDSNCLRERLVSAARSAAVTRD